MKLVYMFVLSILIISILSGCNVNTDVPTAPHGDESFEEEEINFNIDQILYSKSYQSIEPNVELITKNSKLKLLASLGLADYSSVSVNRIIKKGGEVSIHVSGISQSEDNRLAVPQVIMEIEDLSPKNAENLKFSVAYDDYVPIKIKFGINDVINKIQSHFKVSPNRLPTFNLTKEGDDILWSVSYDGIIDKDDPLTPLINLATMIDANSGEILQSDRIAISTTFDYGQILDFMGDSTFLYKKTIVDLESNIPIEQLWYGKSKENEKFMLFSSDFKILSAQFSEDRSHISILEANDDNSNLYIISLSDKRAFKISFESKFNPRLMKWAGNNQLYLVENGDMMSTIYIYDIPQNETFFVGKFERNINRIVNKGDTFLISEILENEPNRKIMITENWASFQFINDGFSPKFISDKIIAFLNRDEKNDMNYLYIYDLKENKVLDIIEGNIAGFEILLNNNIVYINKNMNYDDYTIFKYDFETKDSTKIITANSSKVFLNEQDNLVYFNIPISLEDNKTELIYEIDLNKINQNP
ncbi:MAG: DUF5050 domain-containing protein [Tissierellaceae bacterium]|nr:DUF5050 domain-containing protein [Tissierellaceae bacterium]